MEILELFSLSNYSQKKLVVELINYQANYIGTTIHCRCYWWLGSN